MRNPIILEDLEFITNSDVPWDRLEGKNILISGGSGFLPNYLVETILFLNETKFKKKAKVFLVDKNKEKVFTKFADYKNRDDLVFLIQDVCVSINIKDDIHFIIHAASLASPKYFISNPVETLSANIFGTKNLLELAMVKKVESLLFFSSGEIYGQVSEEQIPIKENTYGYLDPINVRSCYAESKRMGETMCVSWFSQYGVPIKIVRPFHIYGSGIDPNDGRVQADFVFDVVNNHNITLKSDGSTLRTFCYIADATVAFFIVLLKGKNGEAYNIANSEAEISMLNLANLLASLFPEKKIKVEKKESTENLKHIISRALPDISKIANLDWTPKYSLKEGFIRTIKSFLNE